MDSGVLTALREFLDEDSADTAFLRAQAERSRNALVEETAGEMIRRRMQKMRPSQGPLSQAEYAHHHGYIAGVEDAMSILDAITQEANRIEQTRAEAAEAAKAGGR